MEQHKLIEIQIEHLSDGRLLLWWRPVGEDTWIDGGIIPNLPNP